MTSRFWIAPTLVLAAGIAATVCSSAQPSAEAPQQPTPTAATTTLDDQAELAVTIYNSDLALVRDVRNLQLPRGTGDLHFMDIAATVNPATVHFRSLTDPSRVGVLEQNYEYDLLEPEKLLKKYVGREVTLIRTRQENGVTRDEEVKAVLLSDNNGPVWQIGGEIVTGLRADHIKFPELPGNLFSRPTLIWTLENTGGTRHRVEASYLAGKLSWNADYVLTVARDDKSADIDGWVTVVNGSGTSFKHASLQLVAGELNRVRQQFARAQEADRLAPPAASLSAPMAEESFSDYHLYTLGRKTSIMNSETKQVSMLGATAFPLTKRYVVEGRTYYFQTEHPGAAMKDPVQVFYQFKNEQKGGLGMPMPAGNLRVYQADSHGSLQFVGEDRIGHTPKDETLNVKIGNAFDIVCETKQTNFRRLPASRTYEEAFEITIRNHKSFPVSVEVNEPIGGTWQMLSASHEWTKSSAWAAQFAVPVNADSEAVLKYNVRITY